jgi:hypothetical protein
MIKFLSLAFVLFTLQVQAQGRTETASSPLRAFFKMKDSPAFGWRRVPTSFISFPGSDTQSSFSYWMGSSYTSHSENGRFRSTHLFDVLGHLRESRASVSLRKSGPLSYWRIQISPQRHRPLFIYTIPN